MSRLSLVIVNFHSADLTARAIASARATTDETLEIVIVDNSCDTAEADRLRNAGADRVIVSDQNRGYGGGLNDGVAAASGDVLLLANPDLVFHERAIARLLAELSDDVGLTGPRFFWDAGNHFMLPSPERPRPWRKRSEIFAETSASLQPVFDFSRFRRRVTIWTAEEPLDLDVLSGALMAVKRDTFERIGGFDERFRLYFEEIDFMERLVRAGKPLRYVPDAHCQHFYNQSAGASSDSARLFVESEIAFFEKWYGEGVLSSMRRRPARRAVQLPPMAESTTIDVPTDGASYVIELSPLPQFESAAGCLADPGPFEIPPDIIASLRGQRLFCRVIDKESGVAVNTAELPL